MNSVNARPQAAWAPFQRADFQRVSPILFTLLALTLFTLLLPSCLHAQGNYVYVNHQDVANSISAFSVSATGTLSQAPGSPYPTGGVGTTGTCPGVDRITIGGAANTLYVSNSGDQTITAMKINPASGALTAVAGSPFAGGLTLDSCQGISLAATPDGRFLMASSNGTINTFAIAADG
ncbi:MAG TPA: beta-propeller fold lactonase family protein, partial [Terriglobia bacterium]|nr:beta-propeller fold lactonase family protein [Terriglobia bacterium]